MDHARALFTPLQKLGHAIDREHIMTRGFPVHLVF